MAISFFHEPRADQRAGGGVGVLVSDQLKTEMCVEPKHPKGAESEIMALGSLVSESFLAHQFILYTKCLDGKEDLNLES